MTTQNADNIYDLGNWLGYLEATVDQSGASWGNVRDALQQLSKYKNVDGLQFIGDEAQSTLFSLARTYKQAYQKEFSDEDCGSLSNSVLRWCGRLEEIRKRWFIAVTTTTTLDITKLSSGARLFFEEHEWSLLNGLEQKGLDEAAYNLRVNNFTSSEFMALRSLESLLRRWYEKKKNKPFDAIKQMDIFKTLDEEYPDLTRPHEISALFHFKNRRNAIAHPEVISTVEDASVTFTYTISTIKAVQKVLLQ